MAYRGSRDIALGRWVVRTLFVCLNRFLEIGLSFVRPLVDCMWFVCVLFLRIDGETEGVFMLAYKGGRGIRKYLEISAKPSGPFCQHCKEIPRMFYEGVVRQLSRKFACCGDDQATLSASWSSDSTCLRLGLSWMRSRPRKKWKDRESTGMSWRTPHKARS